MGHIGLEAGAQFLEGLFLFAEERIGRAGAVLFCVIDEEAVFLVAGPVEDQQIGVGGEGGGGADGEDGCAEQFGDVGHEGSPKRCFVLGGS